MRKLIIIIAIVSVGCNSEPPKYLSTCVESHTELVVVPSVNMGGITLGSNLSMVPRDICDKEIIKENPNWELWKSKQEKQDNQ